MDYKIAILIFIVIIIICYFCYFTSLRNCVESFVNSITDSNFKNIIDIKTGVDGEKYSVQSEFEDKDEAAEMIAELNNIVIVFIDNLYNKYPFDDRVKRLKRKYNPKKVIEGNPHNAENSTSYSISKGEQLVWCIRSKKNSNIHKKNLLMFVVIHELAHIASVNYGHGEEFLENFKFLLEEAIDDGIYVRQNFFAQPEEYCGMQIHTTPV